MKTAITSALLLVALAAGNASAQFGIRVGSVQVSTASGPHIAVTSPYASTQMVTAGPAMVNPTQPGVGPYRYARLASNLYGSWYVQANHVTASLELAPSGFAMNTGQIDETGVWDGQPLPGARFELTLQSSLRGNTKFQAAWIVPGRQFQMISLSSGVTYTVTRNNPTPSLGMQATLPFTQQVPVTNMGTSVPSTSTVTPTNVHNGML